ncbi:MAG: DUF1684 domain-containing protein [Gammaproteobacteria bacterium]|nr:DUF1684 domain-containing protein [Gammaproteobacteria bacterium]
MKKAIVLLFSMLVLPALSAAPDWEEQTQAWRSQRIERLKAQDGWLTLVGLYWFQPGENRFGAAQDNDLVLRVEDAPGHIGSFFLADGKVRFRAAPGSQPQRDGMPLTETGMAPDTSGAPTVLNLGTLSFHVIERGGELGLRVKDQQARALRDFTGIRFYDLDPSWRIQARFIPASEKTTIPVPTVLNRVVDIPSPGRVAFERDGRSVELAAADGGEGRLFLIFGDPSNGSETYAAGRYLYTEAPRDGQVVVDFNRAYNPPCAFTDFATCPLPPRGNRLRMPVPVGERAYLRPAGAAAH